MRSIQMKTTQAIKPRDSYWVRRFKRHVRLAAAAVAIISLVYLATPPPDIRHRLSLGTAYAGLAFLAATLGMGPWNLLRKRPNPVSFDLRRDMGIWAGALAIVHTAIGLTLHLRGRMWMYFFKRLHPPTLQNTQFGLANFVGLGPRCSFFCYSGSRTIFRFARSAPGDGSSSRDGHILRLCSPLFMESRISW